MEKYSKRYRIGLSLIVLLCFTLSSQAQGSKPKNNTLSDYRFQHFGYSVGVNLGGFTLNQNNPNLYSMKLTRRWGININGIIDFRLAKYLNFRFLPGIQFTERDLTVLDKFDPAPRNIRIESIFIDLPLLLKYHAERVNNYAPYLVVGINPRLGLIRNEIVGFVLGPPLLKWFDIYPELGVGIDSYLSDAKLGIELKFSVGLLDIFMSPPITSNSLDYTAYRAGTSSIFSRILILAVNIE
jgi:hypothetical protein